MNITSLSPQWCAATLLEIHTSCAPSTYVEQYGHIIYQNVDFDDPDKVRPIFFKHLFFAQN